MIPNMTSQFKYNLHLQSFKTETLLSCLFSFHNDVKYDNK